MVKALRLSLFVFLAGTLFISTGCMKKKANRLTALEAQVNVLTDEVARLDQALQESRGGQVSSAGANLAETGIYRTPSGFELPSINIQKALKNAGYYQGAVDGRIGGQTKEAVKAFQRDHGLEGDGVVGRKTWDKLETYLTASN